MVSGILQCGYPSGFLLAAVVYGLLYRPTYRRLHLRLARHVPASASCRRLLVLFIRSHVPESPGLRRGAEAGQARRCWQRSDANWGLAIYAVVLMMLFNFFSHGTQDLYPTFLKKQHGFDPHTVSWITIVANIGAIVGGLTFGALSERIGRVNAITIACLIALPALPLWAYSHHARHAGASAPS